MRDVGRAQYLEQLVIAKVFPSSLDATMRQSVFLQFPFKNPNPPEQQVILPVVERNKLGKVLLKESRL